MSQPQPDIVSAFNKGNIVPPQMNVPEIVHQVQIPQVQQIIQPIVDDSISIFGQLMSKKFFYFMLLIVALIIAYLTYRWYFCSAKTKKSKKKQVDDEDEDVDEDKDEDKESEGCTIPQYHNNPNKKED